MNKITKRDCEQLRALKKEYRHLNDEYIDAICFPKEKVADTAKDYKTGHPHTIITEGYGDSRFPAIREKMSRKQREIEKRIYDIETFLDGINDSEMRTIMRMRYCDGLTQEEIAEKLGYSRSGIEKKIHRFWKKCSRSSKSNMI